MLPHEIEPFADHHIEALGEVSSLLHQIHANLQAISSAFHLTPDEMAKALFQVSSAQEAFRRFKACMVDEAAQKEKLSTRVMECRLKHK